jgi:hypothetical protein
MKGGEEGKYKWKRKERGEKMEGMHWQKAQERAWQATGCHFIFLREEQALLTGTVEQGWIILDGRLNLKVAARTIWGVELALRDLGLPSFGWS